MPGEVLVSNISDITTVETVTAEYLLLVADRRALPNHPALYYAGAIDSRMSNVIKVPHLGLMGYDTASQNSETGQATNTALADASSTITVVRNTFARSAGDLARIIRGGVINPTVMAQDALMVHANRMTQLICDIIDGYTLTGGTTTEDLDTADVLAALGTAEVGNLTGPFMGVLHGQQWADLALDLGLSVGGSIQYAPAVPEMIQLRGESFKGSFLGVDFFVSNRVNSNGTDRLGAIFGPGAVVWADGTPVIDDPTEQMLIGQKIMFERDRDKRAGVTGWVSSCYHGFSIGIQNGLTLGSDA